ncbi:hypothetical protein ACFE04_028055 [Oxalis oulophora]
MMMMMSAGCALPYVAINSNRGVKIMLPVKTPLKTPDSAHRIFRLAAECGAFRIGGILKRKGIWHGLVQGSVIEKRLFGLILIKLRMRWNGLGNVSGIYAIRLSVIYTGSSCPDHQSSWSIGTQSNPSKQGLRYDYEGKETIMPVIGSGMSPSPNGARYMYSDQVSLSHIIANPLLGDSKVSSFTTHGRKFFGDLSSESKNPVDCDEKDSIRWKNYLQREFTINGLMFDPNAKIVYDYTSTSLAHHETWILCGIRIAARLGFRFFNCIRHNSSSILRLDKQRLLMEMNYMFAYGSAEASLRLLLKFGLLDVLLPIQLRTSGSAEASLRLLWKFGHLNVLLSIQLILFKMVSGDVTRDLTCFWVGILAFHKAPSSNLGIPWWLLHLAWLYTMMEIFKQ